MIVDERRVITAAELQARLTCLQVLSPSTTNLFSLRSGRVQFVPYQYRPVLKLIRSDRARLLVADEVGVVLTQCPNRGPSGTLSAADEAYFLSK